jgi:hypothetical protein
MRCCCCCRPTTCPPPALRSAPAWRASPAPSRNSSGRRTRWAAAWMGSCPQWLPSTGAPAAAGRPRRQRASLRSPATLRAAGAAGAARWAARPACSRAQAGRCPTQPPPRPPAPPPALGPAVSASARRSAPRAGVAHQPPRRLPLLRRQPALARRARRPRAGPAARPRPRPRPRLPCRRPPAPPARPPPRCPATCARCSAGQPPRRWPAALQPGR